MPLVKCLINGQLKNNVNVEDRALHYGDGLFETMLCQRQTIVLWSQHLKRLKKGCMSLGLNLDELSLKKDLKILLKTLDNNSYIIKLIVTRGAAGRGLTVDKSTPLSLICLAYDIDLQAAQNAPAKQLKICKTPLIKHNMLGGLKHLNRLVYVLAAKELDDHDDEGLMLNDAGEMVECITHNVFFVKNNILYTPPIEDCGVAGVKRQQVIKCAKANNISVEIKVLLVSDLKQMDECFITNAVVGLQSVYSINDVFFKQDTMTLKLKLAINNA